MSTVKRSVARGAILTGAVLASGMLVAGLRSDLPALTAADSPSNPALCVATVLPDTYYYQAIAEMNACTGSSVAFEAPPDGPPWAIRGVLPTPGTGGSRTAP